MKDIFNREVVERNTQRTRQSYAATKASTQFQLVTRFFFYLPVYIHGTIFGIGDRCRRDFFLVEESKISNFADGTDDVAAAVFFTRECSQFTTDNVLLRFLIACN